MRLHTLEPGAQTAPSVRGRELKLQTPLTTTVTEVSSQASGAVWVGLGAACSRGQGSGVAVSTPGSVPLPVPHWGLALCGGSACLPFSITRAFS